MRIGDRTVVVNSAEQGSLVETIQELGRPLEGPEDLNLLIEWIGTARYVLLGSASHGTAEFFKWRSLLSQRLVQEQGFAFLAVAGDWPDCYRVNRYVKGMPDAGATAREVLQKFKSWPAWMWTNEETVELVEWLRQHNETQPEARKIGFYGLDVYSLGASVQAAASYLQRTDPAALPAILRVYQTFEPGGGEPERDASGPACLAPSCEGEVVALLMELRRHAPVYSQDHRETAFQTEENALVLRHAEEYYRTLLRGGADAWNARERHMLQTLDRLIRFHGPGSKAIIWQHNTHVGDARFTDMEGNGMENFGQLAREKHGQEGVVLVGFSTHHGHVLAAPRWGAAGERMTVPPAQAGSWEDILHQAGFHNQLLLFHTIHAPSPLLETRGHRAIGAIYHPENETLGHYVPTVLPRCYDAFLYFDETEALHPLTPTPGEDRR